MPGDHDFIDFLNQTKAEDDDYTDQEESEDEESEDKSEGFSVNIPLNGSPLYPRIYTGDSAKPLSTGLFPVSEVGDDNINSTWNGIMSFYG